METFDQWFSKVFLKHCETLAPGKKVMIGDNLGCHFSEEVRDLKFN